MSEAKRGLATSQVYPLVLTNLNGVAVLVVGGGAVGERKILGLVAAGASVRLLSPQATSRLRALAGTREIEWVRRVYQAGDLGRAQLVFAATNQRDVNAQVALAAKNLNLLCNVADRPDEGSFHLPAVYRDDHWVVAVSTAGRSPARAKNLRDKIAAWLQKTGESK